MAGSSEIFSGHFENDTLNGFGKHRAKDGSIYEGGFKNGLRHGRGRFYMPEKSADYFECACSPSMPPFRLTDACCCTFR